MTYCPRCPGRLRKQIGRKLAQQDYRENDFSCHKIEIPHPYSFKTEEDREIHLKTQGLDYEGEYARFDEEGNLIRKGV